MLRWSVSTAKGVAQFDLLHNGSDDDAALALGFDLLALNGKDLRKRPLVERKTAPEQASHSV